MVRFPINIDDRVRFYETNSNCFTWYQKNKCMDHRSFRAPHLGLIPVARRLPLVGKLSEGWPPHVVLGMVWPDIGSLPEV